MSEQHIETRFQVKAPASVIWEALADAKKWPAWSPTDAASLERPGKPTPEGVGAVRKLRTGKITTREQVVAFEPERRLSTRLLSGLPVKDYETDIVLSPQEDGKVTEVSWRASFQPKLPLTGNWAKRRLQDTIDEWGRALVRHAEKVAAETGG